MSNARWVGLLCVICVIGTARSAVADSLNVRYLPVTSENSLIGEGLVPTGLNDLGQVVGYQIVGNREGDQAFLYQGGSYVLLSYPGEQFTMGRGINNLGEIVGDAGSSGFLYDEGVFTPIMVPGSDITEAYAINDFGTVVGLYDTAGNIGGFIYSNGNYTTVDYAPDRATELVGINDLGQIIGESGDTISQVDFTYNGRGFSQIPFSGSDEQFTVTGINNFGQISAEYWDGTKWNPTIYAGGSFDPVTLEGVTGDSTTINGINDWGQVVGQTAPIGVAGGIGYIGAPRVVGASEPGTILLLCIGLCAIAAFTAGRRLAVGGPCSARKASLG